MIHLFINVLAASAGGGVTYVRNVIPQIAMRDDVEATVLVDSRLEPGLQSAANVTLIAHENPSETLSRFRFEQSDLRSLIRRSGANVLLSAGNFALWNSPVPQILLSRNALYTSSDFLRDLRARSETRLWIETQLKGALARWSIQTADVVVAPSEAFASELQLWSGKPITTIHHGFDGETFTRDVLPLPPEMQRQVNAARDSLRLLFVSHYNYYRNFETLLRALPLIQRDLGTRGLRLFLTCKLDPGDKPGGYDPSRAAMLVRDLGLSNQVVQLGPVPYQLLHRLYRAADVYVTPAYAESFAHPLVEAMASGLPIVASDLAVHREICGAAAIYFPRFSPPELARNVLNLWFSKDAARQLSLNGLQGVKAFSWKRHVHQIVSLAHSLPPTTESGVR